MHMMIVVQGLYCSPHKQPGMINVKQKHCAFEGCTNRPSFNFPGATLKPPRCLACKASASFCHATTTGGGRRHMLP